MLLTGAAVLGTQHSAAACVLAECPGVVLTCCHSVQAATVRNFFFSPAMSRCKGAAVFGFGWLSLAMLVSVVSRFLVIS